MRRRKVDEIYPFQLLLLTEKGTVLLDQDISYSNQSGLG